jgi:RND family efflux transporter MFP subunit
MLIGLVVIVVLALLAGRAWYTQYAEREAAQLGSAPPDAAHPFMLAPSDVARAQVQTLVTGLPVTGTLRAKDTALITARVAGVLRDLTVREGDAVSAGQVIARVEPSEYDQRYQQAQLQAEAARAQVEIAQRQYDNNVALKQQDFISPTALANSSANLDAAQANYRAAQAGAAVARHSVADTVLTAPITGAVSRRLVQPGERVVPQAPVIEIVDLNHLELQASVSPGDSVAVRVGQTARLTVEGSPDAVTATVTRINPSARPGSRDVLVYLTLPTDAPGLRQGLFAQGVLETGETRALAVPLDAVRTDKPQPYIQVVKKGRVYLVPVQIDARGAVRTAAGEANAAVPADDDETWVAVHVLDGPEAAASRPGAAISIEPGDWVLRSTAGSLGEGTAVKLLQPR